MFDVEIKVLRDHAAPYRARNISAAQAERALEQMCAAWALRRPDVSMTSGFLEAELARADVYVYQDDTLMVKISRSA